MPLKGELCLNSFCMKLLIDVLLNCYRQQLYGYNSIVKKYNVYLKPLHIVIKNSLRGTKKVYYYFGRYWYRLEVVNSKLKWIYLGREKPFDFLPDPPINPLLIIEVKRAQSDPSLQCIYVKNFGEVSKHITHVVKIVYDCCREPVHYSTKICVENGLK